MSVTTRRVNDPTTLWSFDMRFEHPSGNAPPGGLVLKDMRHDAHNFAKDVRLVGMWLTFETVNASTRGVIGTTHRFCPLDGTYFTGAPIQEMRSPATGAPPADVSMANYFYPGYGLRALFLSKPAVFAGLANPVFGELRVTQSWQFSAYANSPPHEPSGGLHAARFHPITTYRLVLNPHFDPQVNYTRVASVRFDYRLHLRLDRSHAEPDAANAPPVNHAGLFRDADAPSQILPPPPLQGAGFTQAVFTGIEKPLAREVVAPGLHNGLSTIDLGAAAGGPPRQQMALCWDNVHWWGARQSGHISTPGGFHAVHMHWRWGAPAISGVPFLLSPPPNPGNFVTNLPRGLNFRDYLANGTIWGALVDPAIWMQTLQVAVTRHVPRLDPDIQPLSSLSTQEFRTLFTASGAPADISSGTDCVLWYSVTIPREVRMPTVNPGTIFQSGGQVFASSTGGSVFLHGMFFAHDPERAGRFIGDTAPAYRPRTLRQLHATPAWFRPAS